MRTPVHGTRRSQTIFGKALADAVQHVVGPLPSILLVRLVCGGSIKIHAVSDSFPKVPFTTICCSTSILCDAQSAQSEHLNDS